MDITAGVDGFTRALDPIQTRPEIMCTSTFRSPFSLAFHEPAAHMHIVESGHVLVFAGTRSAHVLGPHDIALVRPGETYVLTSDRELPPTPIGSALTSGLSADGRHLTFGGEAESAQVLCARFRVAGSTAPQLIGALPEVIVMNLERDGGRRWLLEIVNQLRREVSEQPIGSPTIVTHLLHVLFVDVIRGWALRAGDHLSRIEEPHDPPIARALAAIHAEPARPWTVNGLAAHAGVSRSTFAQRFAAAVGEPPLRYVTNTRLQSAFTELRTKTESITEIAARAGYSSESAFTRAFKSRFGAPPGAIRKTR